MSQDPTQPPMISGGVLSVPASALTFAASRSSGPGGQNVNKQNTRIELRVPLAAIMGLSDPIVQRLKMLAGKRLVGHDEIRIVSQETRSLESNREIAIEQLIALLTEASHLPKKRYATRPSRGAKRRRLQAKKHRGEVKISRKGPSDE